MKNRRKEGKEEKKRLVNDKDDKWEQVKKLQDTLVEFGKEKVGVEKGDILSSLEEVKTELTGFKGHFDIKDIHTNKHYWNTGIPHGTADVVVFESKALCEQDAVKLVFELKKINK
ncbi:11326_t:CDS:2 [Entrophospora sp. SA101]|nr:18082_t:CDS:2 [Entrophospora sp. SA101]CAJ0754947.1 21190_t:CDS:2 [Entrophospora sp. SA101]CAJ0763792.1 11326_t:CDS:2 [Entrophospora sp. SA101]